MKLTPWFSGKEMPVRQGRYLVKYAGRRNGVHRYWNGLAWQYNRRKPDYPMQEVTYFDLWRGKAK